MKKWWWFCFGLGLTGVGVLGARSFAQPDMNGVAVHMVVTVEAHKGPTVPVVNREDVLVNEGRERDKVTGWVPATGEHAGLEYFILLDDSSTASLARQLADLKNFIDAQPGTAKIGLAYMRNGTAMIEQNLTTDHALVASKLRLPMGIAAGDASPYFALTDLLKRWPASGNRREVLMATDGIDHYYGGGDMLDPYLSAAIEDAQRAEVVVSGIYTPGIGHFGHSYWRTYWGQLYLARLAEDTGGEAYYIGFTGSPVTFTPYLDDQASRLNHQYLLTFLAKPQKKAGLRPVKIKTEVPNAELVSASQVFVPAEPQ